MFIGHFAVAMAAKKAAPKTGLGTLVIASQLLDLVWPILVLAGIEHFRIVPGHTGFSPFEFTDYPFSHSLAMACAWGVAMGGVYYALRRDIRASSVIAGVVVSHWILDMISHTPDMPLWPGVPLVVGLGLWNSFAATIVVEGLIFAAGVWVYLRSTTGADRTGSPAFWLWVGVLLIIYVSSMLGAPPSITAVAVAGEAGIVLFALWAYWIDRHRRAAAALAR